LPHSFNLLEAKNARNAWPQQKLAHNIRENHNLYAIALLWQERKFLTVISRKRSFPPAPRTIKDRQPTRIAGLSA